MSPPNGRESEDPKDSTRKRRREQARSQRKALEHALRASATRRRRLIQLGGLAAVVVAAIIVILLASAGPTKPPTPSDSSPIVAEVKSLLQGIPQEHNRLGDPNAPVTLQYFGDLECPYCANFTKLALPTIIDELVRPGKLKIEYHSFSTATGNAEREGAEPAGTFDKQQAAALAAGQQNKMWYFVELFYHEQGEEDSGYVTEPFLQGLAEQVPDLNLPDWTSARGEKNLATEVEHDGVLALEDRFGGTPSFLVGKSGTTLKHFEAAELYDTSEYVEAIKHYLS